MLFSPWIDAKCLESATAIQGSDTTWTSLILAIDNGGKPEWVYETEDEGQCEYDSIIRAPSMTADISGKPAASADCSPPDDGSGGDAGELHELCLYYDYYDADGNFLYTELQYCWTEYVD